MSGQGRARAAELTALARELRDAEGMSPVDAAIEALRIFDDVQRAARVWDARALAEWVTRCAARDANDADQRR